MLTSNDTLQQPTSALEGGEDVFDAQPPIFREGGSNSRGGSGDTSQPLLQADETQLDLMRTIVNAVRSRRERDESYLREQLDEMGVIQSRSTIDTAAAMDVTSNLSVVCLSTAPTASMPLFVNNMEGMDFALHDTWGVAAFLVILFVQNVWGVANWYTSAYSASELMYRESGQEKEMWTYFWCCCAAAMVSSLVWIGLCVVCPERYMVSAMGISATCFFASLVVWSWSDGLLVDIAVAGVLYVLLWGWVFSVRQPQLAAYRDITAAVGDVVCYCKSVVFFAVVATVFFMLVAFFAWVWTVLVPLCEILFNSQSIMLYPLTWLFLMLLSWLAGAFQMLVIVVSGAVTAKWYYRSSRAHQLAQGTFWKIVGRILAKNSGSCCAMSTITGYMEMMYCLMRYSYQGYCCACKCACCEQRMVPLLQDLAERAAGSLDIMSFRGAARVGMFGNSFTHAAQASFDSCFGSPHIAYFEESPLQCTLFMLALGNSLFLTSVAGSSSTLLGLFVFLATLAIQAIMFAPLCGIENAICVCFSGSSSHLARIDPGLYSMIQLATDAQHVTVTDLVVEDAAV